jgi:hypothetical protein
MKVENMTSSRGNKIANQFIITNVLETGVVTIFQSYSTIIARIWTDPVSAKNHTQLDRDKWDYSVTTGRYRNQFLGETKKETQKKIDSGEYSLVDLNKSSE